MDLCKASLSILGCVHIHVGKIMTSVNPFQGKNIQWAAVVGAGFAK